MSHLFPFSCSPNTINLYLCHVIFSDFVQRTSQSLEVWHENGENRGPLNSCIMIWVVLIIVVVVSIVFAVVQTNSDKKNEEARQQVMTNSLANVPDFKPSTKVVGVKSLYTVAFDNDHQKVLYLVGQSPKIFNYEDIISVQLLEEDQTVSQKSTGRTVGGALVGGALAGGAGAIIGGLSGSSKNLKLHSSVKVKILLRNTSTPSITIDCFNASTMTFDGKPVKDGSVEHNYIYKQGLGHAKYIVDFISVIIDAVDRAHNTTSPQVSSGSTADELAKLAHLKEKGVLTEEEFAEQKKKLLDGSVTSAPDSQQKKLELSLPKTDPFEEELRILAMSGEIFQAIKLYRDHTGCDLKTAVDYVNSIS